MNDQSDLPERGEPHQPGASASASAWLLQEMQLYGHHPYDDEPDGRPLPDDRLAGGAVADMFDAMAGCLVDTRIEPDLEDLLWGIVNIFHRAGERIERELDRNEQAQKQLQRSRTTAKSVRSSWNGQSVKESPSSSGATRWSFSAKRPRINIAH